MGGCPDDPPLLTAPSAGRRTDGAVAREHQAINRIVACTDENAAGGSSPASSLGLYGHGGIASAWRITGLDRNTISRGRYELDQADVLHAGPGAAPGGTVSPSRPDPGIVKALEELLADVTAGDPDPA